MIESFYTASLLHFSKKFDSTKTKNKKPLVHTFVTTFSFGEGKRHSIVHSEVTMDDLFNF